MTNIFYVITFGENNGNCQRDKERRMKRKELCNHELYEETSQIVSDLEFKGLLKVKNLSNDEVKYESCLFYYS